MARLCAIFASGLNFFVWALSGRTSQVPIVYTENTPIVYTENVSKVSSLGAEMAQK
jgi:predicted HAD superfamily hydrolase